VTINLSYFYRQAELISASAFIRFQFIKILKQVQNDFILFKVISKKQSD